MKALKSTPTLLANSSWDELEVLFQKGEFTGKVHGFYRGKLLVTRINPLTDLVMSLLKKRLMPWKGKFFDGKKKRGINVVSKKARFLLHLQQARPLVEENGKTIEVFPFKTSLGKGTKDKKRPVFLLNYDIPANPPAVRRVADELIKVGKDLYLGRAKVKVGRSYKTVAYFSLHKS